MVVAVVQDIKDLRQETGNGALWRSVFGLEKVDVKIGGGKTKRERRKN